MFRSAENIVHTLYFMYMYIYFCKFITERREKNTSIWRGLRVIFSLLRLVVVFPFYINLESILLFSFISFLDGSDERKLISFSDYRGQGCHLPRVFLFLSIFYRFPAYCKTSKIGFLVSRLGNSWELRRHYNSPKQIIMASSWWFSDCTRLKGDDSRSRTVWWRFSSICYTRIVLSCCAFVKVSRPQ